MEEKETIHINLLTELTGNLISEESEWEEEWTENDAYGMPLDGTDMGKMSLCSIFPAVHPFRKK